MLGADNFTFSAAKPKKQILITISEMGPRLALRRLGIDLEKDGQIVPAGGNPERLAAISKEIAQFTIMNEPFIPASRPCSTTWRRKMPRPPQPTRKLLSIRVSFDNTILIGETQT